MTAAELEALAQRVVETWETLAERPPVGEPGLHYREACRALARALDEPDAGLSVHSARVILAALDDARKAGWEDGYEDGYDEGLNDGMAK